jgi:hypothetical protein
MSLDVEIFRNVLREEFEENYDDFNDIIIDTHCLIAGGSVLAAYTNGRINDFDIYVHKSHAKVLKDRLIDLLGYQFNVYNNYLRPAYDESFFRKNGILARFSLSNDLNRYLYPIDIMIIPDNIPLRRVVQNFDFTFCEIWYDGNSVNATNPGQVLIKKGFMRKDYVKTLLTTFNKFLISRITKYKYRGFIITYECSVDNSFIITPIPSDDRHPRIVTTPEEWVAMTIYKGLLFPCNMFRKNSMLINLTNTLVSDENTYALYYDSLDIILNYGYNYICDNQIVYSMESVNNLMTSIGIMDPERIKEIYGEAFNASYIYTHPQNFRFSRYIFNITGITIDYLKNLYYSGLPDSDLYIPLEPPVPIPHVFETENTNERLLPHDCFNIFIQDTESIRAYLDEDPGNFIFVMKGLDNYLQSVLCFSKDSLNQIVVYNDNRIILRVNDVGNTYIKIPVNSDGLHGYVKIEELQTILNSNYQVYYVLPKLEEDGIQQSVNEDNRLLLIYTIKICRDPERCIISISRNEEDESHDDELSDSESSDEYNDDINYIFETEDMDENLLPITCFDLYEQNETDINNFLQDNEDNFLFVVKDTTNNITNVLCLDIDYLIIETTNRNNFFYECIRSPIQDSNEVINFAYIKIKLSVEDDTLYGLIPRIQLEKCKQSFHQIYYIVPVIENGIHKKISNIITWRNYRGVNGRRDNCIYGVDMPVYDMKICTDPVRCIRSILYN